MKNCIVDIFEKTVSRFSDRIAIADEKYQFTFEQLLIFAKGIASLLDDDEVMIGVMSYRDAFTIPAFLGVTYCGKCYIPIDPDLPKEKMQKIILDSGMSMILSRDAKDQEIAEVAGIGFKNTSSVFENTADVSTDDVEKINKIDQQLLYLVYTSGSTGVPKGVAKSYEAMRCFIDAYKKEFAFDENTVIGNQTPFYFDASAKDIYLMLACGARLEILPTTLFSFPVRLIEYMNQRKVNFISWVPSALSIITTLNTFSEIVPEYVKKVFFVGEVFAAKHLNKWIDALPDSEFVNLYGSSEICGISCYYRIQDKLEENEAIPIGRALSNCDVKLVVEGHCENTANVVGEIYVASPALAECYYGDETKTASSFTVNDFGDGIKRYYHTGDMARYDEFGNLVFVTRSDSQIKHMGHRIELGEIETVATSIDGVDKCCCLYDNKKSRIMLYVQLEQGIELTQTELRKQLKQRLSDYMVPHRIKCMDKLPVNANGKVDRVLLKQELN